jgi:hypothetical protein
MTAQQKDLFIEMAQTGIACGLYCVFEWYVNYQIHFQNMYAYTDIPQKEIELLEMMLAFFKDTNPPGSVEISTKDDLNTAINTWYSFVQRQRTKK